MWFLNVPCPGKALEGHHPRRTDFFFFFWRGDCFFAELGPSVQNNGGMFFNMNCENMMEIIKVKLIQMWEIF